MHIFLDMDGVLCDFVSAALKAHNREDLSSEEFDLCHSLEMSLGEFWRVVDQTPNFWLSIKPYSWFHELVDFIDGKSEFFILTAPSLDASSYEGKRKWVSKYFGRRFNRLILTKYKWLLARPDTLLIDDSERNCEMFEQHGGHKILFPQPWNTNRVYVDDRLKFVKNELRAFISGVYNSRKEPSS